MTQRDGESVDADVVVVGAGPAGLAASRAAALAGRSVLLLDGAPADECGSGLTLWPNALIALRGLGIDDIELSGAICDGMRTMRPDGSVLQELDSATMQAQCGGNGLGITRAALVERLNAALPGSVRVERAAAQWAGSRGDAAAVVRTADGDRTGRVVVGADGAHSCVRTGAVPSATRDRDLGLCVFRGLSSLDVSPHPGEVTLGRGAQFGVFPVPGGTYWFAALPVAGEFASVPLTLAAWFGSWHVPMAELLAATPMGRILRHVVVDRRLPRPWATGRLTLVGDAAHLAAPTLGQGTCHALEDAVALGSALRASLDAQSLRSFERARRPRVAAMVRQSHLLAVAGQWRNPLACAMRDLSLCKTTRTIQLRQLKAQFGLA